MKKLLLFFLLALYFSFCSWAQNDSCKLRISLLTCSPGEELYSTFGHTALRVQELGSGGDYIFNYGTFEFGPDFYSKFIRGKLLYFLSVENFNDFMYTYQYESRSVVEQELKLDCPEKEKLFAALRSNAREDQKYYKYDFLFDNCTTRARDIVARNTKAPVSFKNILPQKRPSFRDQIHSYLDAGHQNWSKLGIDILLGARLDRKPDNLEAMFLPDYLLKGFDSAAVDQAPLVARKQTILNMPSPIKGRSFFTPGLVFSLLLVLIGALSWIRSARAATILLVFDFLFFFVLGLAGLLLVFMWTGTDHTVCANNYNLLWALPTHIVMAFFVHSTRNWVKKYFRIVRWISVALALTWFFLPQDMNNALLPVVLLTGLRSWQISKKDRYAKRSYKS